jgi:hypothetical protein
VNSHESDADYEETSRERKAIFGLIQQWSSEADGEVDAGAELVYRYCIDGLVKAMNQFEVEMITTVAELDALPEDSVILDDGWYPKIKGQNGKWWRPDCPRGIAAQGTLLPTRLLWTPEDGQLT